MDLKEKIEDALREVYDPEIPINVYDLGLIYNIEIKEKNNVEIIMTLTSPTCPTADYIEEQVKQAVEGVEEINKVEITMTFEPPWSPERVSQEAKEELGLSSPQEDLAVKQVFDDDSVSKEKYAEALKKIEELESENKKLKEKLDSLK